MLKGSLTNLFNLWLLRSSKFLDSLDFSTFWPRPKKLRTVTVFEEFETIDFLLLSSRLEFLDLTDRLEDRSLLGIPSELSTKLPILGLPLDVKYSLDALKKFIECVLTRNEFNTFIAINLI